MRKAVVLLVVCLLLCPLYALAADDDSWVVVEDDYTPDLNYQADFLMRRMTLEDRIYQMLFLCPEDMTGEEYTVEWPDGGVLAQKPVGGILLFGQNIVSGKQLEKLTGDIMQDAENAPYPPFLAVEEEGGTVSRVANKLGYPLQPAPAAMGSAEAAYQAGKAISEYLRPFHINLNFAPCADVPVEPGNELGDRCFAGAPEAVSEKALSFMKGLKEGGIAACYKHFPGQGAATGKIYKGTAKSRRSLDEMTRCELIPFMDAVKEGVPMIMVSHMEVYALDDQHPASLSETVMTRLLRERLGFDGVILTDSLRGRAIRDGRSMANLAVACVQAGADMLLLPKDADVAAQGLLNAVKAGILSEERINQSVRRILIMKINIKLLQ